MISHIKTTKANKEIITRLTNRFNLGAENVIARIAIAYSLSKDRKLNLDSIGDANGKEYSNNVLFGDYSDVYIGMICVKYGISSSDVQISKYVKMHLDDGVSQLNEELGQLNADISIFCASKLMVQK